MRLNYDHEEHHNAQRRLESEQRQQMLNARTLHYLEMIGDKRKPLVGPERIPVHAAIYQAPNVVYSKFLADKVIDGLEGSIDADKRELQKMEILLPRIHPVELEVTVKPGRLVEFRYDGIAARLTPDDTSMTRVLIRDGPLPEWFASGRAKDFSLTRNGITVPSWCVEGADKAAKDINILMTLRNAAILFNNLGAYELQKTE